MPLFDKNETVLQTEHITAAFVRYDNGFGDGEDFLSHEERAYISNAAPLRAAEFSAGRYALKTAFRISSGVNCAMNEIRILREETGRPYICGSPLGVSVTHDGNIAAAMLSSSGSIGIDLHKITVFGDEYMLFLNEQEIKLYNAANDKQNFLNIVWCMKESCAKYLGGGLALFEEIDVRYIDERDEVITAKISGHMAYLVAAGGYCFSVVADKVPSTEINKLLHKICL